MLGLEPDTVYRPDLAEAYCDSLAGIGLRDCRSGLFLSASAGAGKTQFLRLDLLPAMIKRGWIALYVDFTDIPDDGLSQLIGNAIKTKVADLLRKKETSAAGSISSDQQPVWVALNAILNSPKLPIGVTLSDALEALLTLGKAPVALILDEPQHALDTDTGVDALFALKAARDYLNLGAVAPRLFCVFAGSDPEKLANLVRKPDQPFFGSALTKFPPS